jgi:hypothetical protein
MTSRNVTICVWTLEGGSAILCSNCRLTYKLLAAESITPAVGCCCSAMNARPITFVQVFGGKLWDQLERYSTLEEACAGHRAMVERARDFGEKE